MSRVLRGLGLGFVAMVLVAGCSDKTGGSPVASGGGTPTTQSSSTSTTRPSTTGSNSNIKPCELLSASDQTSLGVGPGKPSSAGNLPTCVWTASGKFGITAGLANKGLTGLNGETVELPKHKAVKSLETGGFGGCGVVIGISDNSSLIITASVIGGGSQEQACPHAIDFAKIIDPKLP
jgi:hypothetical protein